MSVVGWVLLYWLVGNLVGLAVLGAASSRRPLPAESGMPLVLALVILTWPAWLLAGVLVGLWVLVTRRGASRAG